MKEKLSVQILKKDFKISPQGWDVREVDSYLDEIVSQVKELENQIVILEAEKRKLENANKGLELKNEELKAENSKIKSKTSVSYDPDKYSNFEIVRRIAKLETAVNDVKQVVDEIKNKS